MFLNETARQFGSVFLPAASSFERDGTFMNAERRIQRIRKAIEPVGQSKPDWEIICALAGAMGKGQFFDYRSAEEIWNEIRSVWEPGSGITYARLEHGGLQWPCATKIMPGRSCCMPRLFRSEKGHATSDSVSTNLGTHDRRVSVPLDYRPHSLSIQCRHDDDAQWK